MTMQERESAPWIPDKHAYIGLNDCMVPGCNREQEFEGNDDPHCIFHLNYWEDQAND